MGELRPVRERERVENAESLLSREQVIGRELDLNLGDREIKGDVFGEVFGFGGSKNPRMFLCCRRDIVKILCTRWRHPWRCSNRFWSGKYWKLKNVELLHFCAQEAFDNI